MQCVLRLQRLPVSVTLLLLWADKIVYNIDIDYEYWNMLFAWKETRWLYEYSRWTLVSQLY